MRYPEVVNLPFNAAILKDDFQPLNSGEGASAEEGFWAIVKESSTKSSFVVKEEGADLILHEGPLPEWAVVETGPFCIGRWLGKPFLAARVSEKGGIPAPYVTQLFNAAEDRLDARIHTLNGLARQILNWERTSAHCPVCGANVMCIAGSWGKRCIACAYENYPHVHPCIIVLVRRGDEFLLARKAEWLTGRYSLIAGFLEFGESLEECVQREVREETGIEVTNIHYVGSQNWPFPSQLMAGFVAEYAGGEIVVDRDELEDARWFSLKKMPAGFPGHYSIARWIIDRFMLGIS